MLLCAEDDDLDLVALVHLARLRGLDMEVRPGVESDDSALLGALDETPRALLVIVQSEHLGPERAREIESTFALARTDDQDLIAIRFERRHVGECLESIAKRLEELGCESDAVSTTPDASTGRLAKVGLPIDMEVDVDLDEDPEPSAPREEFEVTVRADLATIQQAVDPVRTHTLPVTAVAAKSRRRRLPWAFGIGASTALAAGVLWLGFGAGSGARSAEVAPAAVAAPEVEVIEVVAPEPEPARAEAWPPPDDAPKLAPTPLSNESVVAPDIDDIVVEPGQPQARKQKRRRR